ncbi:MAG: RNA polymerase sigma factor [Tenuifilaceae bacterium]|nr:RNA polymerase sigma factor [Tenuifilaceae bacterium]
MSAKLSLFNQIYANHHQMVIQLCLGFVNGDRSRAKDLSQEVFINTWNSLERFKGQSSHKTWLYRITVNICLKSLRDTKQTRSVSLDAEQRVEHLLTDDSTSNAAEAALGALYTSIGQLNEVDRLIIMMVLDEADYAQIADVMGISEGNIRVRIHRIKQTLKKLMQNEHAN